MIRSLSRLKPTDLGLIAVLVIWTLGGQYLAPQDPDSTSVTARLFPPSTTHLMGTDDNGFDILSRILAAGQVDVGIALTATLCATLIGSFLGLIITQWEQSPNRILRGLGSGMLRLTEIMQAFPVFILAMILVAAFGANAVNLIFAIAFVNAPVFLRLVRAEAQTLWSLQFSEAARLMGNRSTRISFVHILPNAIGTVINQVSVTIGFGVLLTAGLSFVGAGIKPPTPELGGMIAAGGRYVISGQWWVAVFPGIALAFLIFSFAYLGDRLASVLHARGNGRRAPAAPDAANRPVPLAQAAIAPASDLVLRVENLSVTTTQGGTKLIDDVSIGVKRGESVAVIGASGAGKSLLIRALLGIYDERSLQVTGHLTMAEGEPVDLSLADAETRFHLGISGLVANPRLMLNPVIKVSTYFDRVLTARHHGDRKARFAEACHLLTAVGISDAAVRMNQYPFQLSGGTAQRVCLALALAAGAKVLCFDEPTAGLDVTIQRQVLDLINQLRADFGLSVIFSTSDMALATRFADRILVLDLGVPIELAAAMDLYAAPKTDAARDILKVSAA